MAEVTEAWTPFNLNETVRVKINERGIEHLRRAHDARNACYRDGNPFGDFVPPKVDAEGWTSMQLWAVMQDFGDAITMGITPPFETTIMLPTSAFAAHREAAEKAERQAVVDWAKERAVKSFHADARAAWAKIADIVERGDHRKG